MKKGSRLLVAILCILAIATLGTTVAYFTQDGEKQNKLKMGKVDVEVHEELENGVKNNITATILPNHAECWVRMYVGIPKGNQDKPLFETPVRETEWEPGSDGYYYYKERVAAGAESYTLPVLFKKITPIAGLTEADIPANTDIIVYAEAIQVHADDTDCITAFENFKK